MCRTAEGGWLQGFITVTNFTTWQRYFAWDSLVHEAGVLDDADDEDERVCDVTGELSKELAASVHDGDPGGEGVVWPHTAEISLLGGLGCGGTLLKLVLEEMEQPSSPYNHVILQASENSVGFYEHHGFVRVGAIARYEEDGVGVADAVMPSPAKFGPDGGEHLPGSPHPGSPHPLGCDGLMRARCDAVASRCGAWSRQPAGRDHFR
jgi:hypothetical protein